MADNVTDFVPAKSCSLDSRFNSKPPAKGKHPKLQGLSDGSTCSPTDCCSDPSIILSTQFVLKFIFGLTVGLPTFNPTTLDSRGQIRNFVDSTPNVIYSV
jgi:hypothetical protein